MLDHIVKANPFVGPKTSNPKREAVTILLMLLFFMRPRGTAYGALRLGIFESQMSQSGFLGLVVRFCMHRSCCKTSQESHTKAVLHIIRVRPVSKFDHARFDQKGAVRLPDCALIVKELCALRRQRFTAAERIRIGMRFEGEG